MRLTEEQRERTRRAAKALKRAERTVRVLRSVAWPAEVRERFFAQGESELPVVSYEPRDPTRTLELVEKARALAPGVEILDRWLERIADAIESGARMLAALGTAEFFEHSSRLYGQPRSTLLDHDSTPLELAQLLDSVFEGLEDFDLGAPDPACHLATAVAERMKAAVDEMFGELAPEVVIVDDLSANALAGTKAIRIRRTACFTDRDIEQLIHHEAFIHVATAFNGRAQKELPILGAGHGGTTSTQEGLAVFAELMSGTTDPSRLRRLADRVLAIDQAIEGADFLEVYRFFVDRGYEREQAFESSRRVFRGGPITGGAPFTKDVVYLHGLLRVHNFLRSSVAAKRPDSIHLLFAGKCDIADIPALGLLATEGLLLPPRFLPPWARDLRFLVSYLTYSAFLNRIDLEHVKAHYDEVLARTPVPEGWSAREW